MSTDWIKMRVDLRTHPKVVRMATALRADKLRVIGGLFAVWAIFDAHSEDGVLTGYTFRAIDDELGWKGFSAAMSGIDWLEDLDGESLETPRFGEHNGQSAKRRAMETERKRLEREAEKAATKAGQASASDADKSVTREEKRREEKILSEEREESSPRTVTPAAAICRALRQAGIAAVQSQHPTLLALVEAGAQAQEFLDAAPKAVGKSDPFTYLLGVVKKRREEAAEMRLAPTPQGPSDAELAEQHRIREASRPQKQTPEQKAKSDEIRRKALGSLGVITGATAA